MLRVLSMVCVGISCISPKQELKDMSREQIVFMNQPSDGQVIRIPNTEIEMKEDCHEKKQKPKK